MMTPQVKRLKGILKQLGIKEHVHLTKHQRRGRNSEGKVERYTEYGSAWAIVSKDVWTADQLEALKEHHLVTVTHDSNLFLHVES